MEAFLSSILPEMSLFLGARRILSNNRKIPGNSVIVPSSIMNNGAGEIAAKVWRSDGIRYSRYTETARTARWTIT
jgi:hypothetical protein